MSHTETQVSVCFKSVCGPWQMPIGALCVGVLFRGRMALHHDASSHATTARSAHTAPQHTAHRLAVQPMPNALVTPSPVHPPKRRPTAASCVSACLGLQLPVPPAQPAAHCSLFTGPLLAIPVMPAQRQACTQGVWPPCEAVLVVERGQTRDVLGASAGWRSPEVGW